VFIIVKNIVNYDSLVEYSKHETLSRETVTVYWVRSAWNLVYRGSM